MNLIEELQWRGMLQDVMPGTAEQLTKEMTSGYIGFDPTADSLHIGSLVPILLLMHLQKAGHRPVALVGGATGMIGDPSMKSEERNLLDEATLAHNVAGIQRQLSAFLDFDTTKPNAAVIVNNYDWFKDIGFIGFLRDVGKHITVNYMMAKDSVRKRIEGDTGISYTEFAYQLMQGYDFYWLYTHMGVKLQMGGSDQWGNIVTGTELIRRKGGGDAYALTTQLIKKADGTKFGKSEKGNIFLDAKLTSPYKFYQFWLNAADNDVPNFIRIFSLKNREEIEALEAEHNTAPHLRLLQKALAEEVTARVHSPELLQRAKETTDILFGSSFDDFKTLSGEEIEDAFDADLTLRLSKADFAEGADAVNVMGGFAAMFPSKGEARKNIQGNGVSVNKQKIAVDTKLTTDMLVHGKYLLLQKGKKNYYLVIAE